MPKVIGYTHEEKRKKAHAALLARQKSMVKKTGLSAAARSARAAHSSAGRAKIKVEPTQKKAKVKKLTWWEKVLKGGRTEVIKKGQGPGGVKSDAEKRAAKGKTPLTKQERARFGTAGKK